MDTMGYRIHMSKSSRYLHYIQNKSDVHKKKTPPPPKKKTTCYYHLHQYLKTYAAYASTEKKNIPSNT